MREFVRLMLGFGVSVAVALAPLLGKIKLPLFTPLLNLYPESIREPVIIIGSACIGIVAVIVEWNGRTKHDDAWIRKQFRRSVFAAFLCLSFLIVAWNFCVIEIPLLGDHSLYLVVGFTEPQKPPCDGLSKSECVARKLTVNPAAIDSYWGDNQINIAKLSLELPYWVFLSSFGVMIGLLMLQRPTQFVEERSRSAHSGIK